MSKLTTEQRAFLTSQKILIKDMFDATGLKKQDYQTIMRERGLLFAYGVNPCLSGGHTLRSRSGHCIQCDTKRISFTRRNYDAGTVYIAGSKSAELLKVGYTNDRQRRAEFLNNEEYGGAFDWEILLWVNLEKSAGKVEFDIHQKLSNYIAEGYYIKQGKKTSCYELFSCSYSEAKKALLSVIPAGTRVNSSNEERILLVYEFGKN